MKQTEQMTLGMKGVNNMVMSQIAAELDQKATELGFESLSQAQEAGCEVEWHEDSAELVEPLELAHRAWEKEKEEALSAIDRLKTSMENVYGNDFKPEIAAIAMDGDPDKAFRYLDVLKIKKFIEETHE